MKRQITMKSRLSLKKALPHDLKVYQEYHALLVEHAKRYYQKKGSYAKCPLLNIVQD